MRHLLLALLISGLAALSPARACEIARPVAISTPEADRAAGAPLVLEWRQTDSVLACGEAVFLVIGLDAPARLEGEGLFALAPGERGPFGMDMLRDRTRAVVPLHLEGGLAGRIVLTPFASGGVALDWQIVAIRGERPEVLAGGALPLTLGSGRPRVIVQDRFATESALATRLSPDWRRRLELFDGFFRVTEAETGALVIAAEGAEPGFSPTGRFLHAFGGENFIDGVERGLPTDLRIFDLAAEAPVARLWQDGWPSRGMFITALHWSPADSFLAVSFEAEVGMAFWQALTDRPFRQGQYGCGACAPAEMGLADLSLENALVRLGAANSFHLLSLTDDAAYWDEATAPSSEWMNDTPPPEARLRDPGRALVAFASDGLVEFGLDAPEGRFLNLAGAARASWEWQEFPETQAMAMPAPAPLAGTDRSRAARAMEDVADLARPTRRAARLAALGIVPAAAPGMDHIRLPALESEDPETGWRRIRYAAGAEATAFGADLALAMAIDKVIETEIRLWDACLTANFFHDADLWTLTHSGRIVQFLHFTCTVSTGYGPEGLLLRLESDAATGSVSARAGAVGIFDWSAELHAMDEAEARDMTARHDALPIAAQLRLRVWRLDEGRLAILDKRDALTVLSAGGGFQAQIPLPAASDAEEISLLEDGIHLLQVNQDGRFFVHDPATGAQPLAGRYLDDEVVVFDSALRFEATEEGARHVALKYPGDPFAHGLDQFGALLAGARVVSPALSGATAAPPPPPPVPPRLILLEGAENNATIRAEAGPGSTLARLEIWRDGRRIATQALQGPMVEMRPDLPALPETRGFALRLVDEAGLQSRSLDIAAPPGDAPPEGRLFVLAVGTDQYDDPALSPLNFAVADARNLAAALTEGAASPYYAAIRAEVIADDPDLAQSLPAILADMTAQAGTGDTLLLHVAGHGMLDDAGGFYLATRASRAGNLAGTGLAWDKIARALARFPGRVLVLLDACHSGAAGATNDDAVAELGGEPGSRGNVVVIAASKGRQESLERATRGGGLFTSALVEALTRDRQDTDLDGNGTVELDELYADVKARVVTESQGRQTPWIARNDAAGRIPVH
ncbi:MAG: caspase domain-containing protein [Pseudorhodobacter sp.]